MAYRHWRWALWRELFQNAIDQKASAITITVSALGSDGFRLEFADNGPGMSRETLETVYFEVGASTKEHTEGMIGGMGRARMLTCFCMESWSIRSHDYAVIGAGGSYVVEPHSYTDGCTIGIDVDDCSAERAIQLLHSFLRESRITAQVSLNGVIMTLNSGHLGRHIRNLMVDDTVFARVYVNKGIGSNTVITRVNGVAMFTTESDVSGQVVVELLAESSRTALTSNRDSLHWDYSRALNAFITELSVNTRSATQTVRKRRTTVIAGGGALRTRRRVKPASRPRKEAAPVSEGQASPVDDQPLARAAAFAAPPAGLVEHDDTVVTQNPLIGLLTATFGDIFMFDETDNARVRKTMAAYQPDRWNTDSSGRVKRGNAAFKLLLAWKVLLDYAVELYLDIADQSDCRWSVGFMFDDNDNGANHRDIDGRNIFCLKPVDAAGKRAYSATARADLARLRTLAKHEVAHIAHHWHNEAFSGLREQIDMVFDDTEAYRRVKLALKSLPF